MKVNQEMIEDDLSGGFSGERQPLGLVLVMTGKKVSALLSGQKLGLDICHDKKR